MSGEGTAFVHCADPRPLTTIQSSTQQLRCSRKRLSSNQDTTEVTMGDRLTSMVTVAITAAAVSAAASVLATRAWAQASASSNMALKTPWGEPDLQGIWTEEFDTPLQRPARFGNQEFFTEAQRQELDRQRAAHYGNDPRQERGSAVDVGGAYNTTFLTVKHVSARTSMIV